MRVKINGTVDDIADISSVNDVLAARQIPSEVAIVMLNDEIIRREDWTNVMLTADDHLEIIRVIGGG